MRGFVLGFKSEVQLLWPAWVAGGISLKNWARIAWAQRAWGFGDCCMLTKGFNFGFGSRTAQPPRSGSFLRRIQNWKIIFTCKNCRFIKVALHGWIHHLRALLKIHFFVNAKSLCAVFPAKAGIQFVVFIGFYSNLWVRFSGFPPSREWRRRRLVYF